MEDEQIIILENGLIAKLKKSKIELFKRISLICLIIVFIYIMSFYGRNSNKLSFEFKVIMPTIILVSVFIYVCFAKMVSVISINKLKKELTIEYYQLFKKRNITINFKQFNFVIKEMYTQLSIYSRHKNSYIKLVLDNGKTFTISDKDSGEDSINYNILLELLKEIKPPYQPVRRPRRNKV